VEERPGDQPDSVGTQSEEKSPMTVYLIILSALVMAFIPLILTLMFQRRERSGEGR
jgi:hypothetical protein